MAEWSKNKVEPIAINGGNEFTKGGNLAVNELNAIVNNSFFASEKAEIAEQKVNSFVEEKGKTAVTIKDESQYKWSADFVEKEKSKSLNLWSYGDVQGENEKTTIILDTPTSEGLYYMSFGYKYNSPDYSAQLTIEFYDEDGNKNMLTGITRFHEKDSWWESVIFSRPITKIKIGVTAPNNTDKIYEGSYKLYNITLAKELLLICEKPSGAITHNEDAPVVFAESERQKSKNLLVYPYTGEVYQYGVTFTDNGDGSFTINGKQTDTTANSYHYMETADTFKLSAGTYTLKAFADTSVTGWNLVLYDGTYYHEVSSPNMAKTLTFNEDKYCRVYIQVPKASTTTFNNFVIKPILVKGTEVGEWQPYNGAIVHEKDMQRHIITGHLLADYVPGTTNYTVIPLVQYSKIGNRLTMNSNGGVVIGNDVKNVMVNAGIGMYINTIGYHWISIYKNNNAVATEYMQTKDTAGRNIVLNIPRFLLPVNEGDIITFEFKDSAGNGLQSADLQTQMTVEVVE